MNLEYKVEDYLSALPELRTLYKEHYVEVAVLQDKVALDPDYERYEQLHKAGNLHLVTIRCQGAIVGYHMSIVFRHLHYKTLLCAMDDIFFVKAEHRKGFSGPRLFKEAERTLKEKGVKIFVNKAKRHVKLGHAQEHDVGDLLAALGFKEFERSFIKWIGD